jgi:hypothetical protein
MPYTTPAGGASPGSPASLDYVGTQSLLVAALADPPTGSAIAGHIAETIAPVSATAPLTVTTGSLSIASIRLAAGQSVTGAGFVTSTVAAITPTHAWLALLDSSYVLRAVTADGLTTAIGASTWFPSAFAAPYTATYTGVYFLGVLITAGTIPTLCGATAPLAAMVTGTSAPAPLLGGVSTTSLTTPGTVGTTTYVAPTAAAVTPYLFAY